MLLVLAAILGARLCRLEADPPADLAVSTSIYTDAPAYTMFARMYVETGQISLFGDHRYPFFIKSTVTAAAIVVFKLFGVGLWQSNLVGVLFSFGALLLMFLFVRRIAGALAGFLFLILIGFNYNLLFFGRMPFLEHAMQFWVTLALVLLAYSRRSWSLVATGASLAVGIFFGKIIGLIYLFPFAGLLTYRACHESDRQGLSRWLPTALFAVGFAAVSLFWLAFSYLPAAEQVTGYVGEHTVGYYGIPDAFKSVGEFINAMVTFGTDSRLFERMTVIALLGCGLIGMVLHHVTRRRSWREGFGRFNSGHIFIVAGIIAFFASLMIWNYRPLRYELPLIYLFGAAAAVVLSMIWTHSESPCTGRPSWLFYLLFYPIAVIAVVQLFGGVSAYMGRSHVFFVNPLPELVVAAVITLLSGAIAGLRSRGRLFRIPTLARLMVILIVVGVSGRCLADFAGWCGRTTYTLRDNSRDVAQCLSEDAVLSGPYGPAVGLAGDLDAVIHMFGVTSPDSALFRKFPVTHLLMDELNEDLARADYPALMSQAVHVCTYHIGLEKVRVFRIAGSTGNPLADLYRLSLIEAAVQLRDNQQDTEAMSLARRFAEKSPDNIVANLLIADILEKEGRLNAAGEYIKKAVEFTPTNYNLSALLAMSYKRQYQLTGEPAYKSEGIKYFERAMNFAPTVARIREACEELEASSIDQR